MKGKMKMITLGEKTSKSEIKHNGVLCLLRNAWGMLD